MARKKKIDGWDDTSVTKGSGNIFLDLGFDEDEATVLLMRTDLMISIQRHIEVKGWTQAQAARTLGITAPRASQLKKGVWQEFSLDMLLKFAARLGMRPKLKLAA